MQIWYLPVAATFEKSAVQTLSPESSQYLNGPGSPVNTTFPLVTSITSNVPDFTRSNAIFSASGRYPT